MRPAEKLLRAINQTQRISFVLEYLFSSGGLVYRGRLEKWLDLLESTALSIVPSGELGHKLQDAATVLIPELRQSRQLQALEDILRFETERQKRIFSGLGITQLSDDAYQHFDFLYEAARKGPVVVPVSDLESILDIRKLTPRPVLSDTLISFDQVSGMQSHTPERLFYRDMCWHYNEFLADSERFAHVWKTLQGARAPRSTEFWENGDLFAVGSRTFRHFRSFIISLVTFVESVINGLHFHFLNSPRYESQRRQFQAQLTDPATSKNRKEHLTNLLALDPTDPSRRTNLAFAPINWKVAYLPGFLSGNLTNVPLDKPPFNVFLAINTLWRNTYVHPSYESDPIPRLPKRMAHMFRLESGDLPSKMYVLMQSARNVDGQHEFAPIAADCAIDLVERVYELSFGKNHQLLWWLRRRGSDGRFPHPDDWVALKDHFAKPERVAPEHQEGTTS